MADMDTEVKDRYRQDVRDNIQTMVPGFTGTGAVMNPYTGVSTPGATPPVDPKIELEKMKLNSIPMEAFEKIGNFYTNLTGPAPTPNMQWANQGIPLPSTGYRGTISTPNTFAPIPAQTTQTGFTTPRYTKENPYTGQKPWVNDFLAKSHVSPTVNMTQDATGTWIPAEGGRYMLGPENPAGDIAARNAIRSDFGTAPTDRGYWETGLAVDPETQQRQQIYRPEGYRSYYDANPNERLLDDIEYRMKPFMDQYNKLVEDTRSRAQGYGLPMNPMAAQGMQAGAAKRLSAMADQKLMPIPEYSKILEQSPGSPANQARLAQIPIDQMNAESSRMNATTNEMIRKADVEYKNYLKTLPHNVHGGYIDPKTGQFVNTQLEKDPEARIKEIALAHAFVDNPATMQKEFNPNLYQQALSTLRGQTPTQITFEQFLAKAKTGGSKLSDKKLREAYDERMARGSK